MESVMTSVDNQPKVKELPKFVHFQGQDKISKNVIEDISIVFYDSDFQLHCGADQTFCIAKRENT